MNTLPSKFANNFSDLKYFQEFRKIKNRIKDININHPSTFEEQQFSWTDNCLNSYGEPKISDIRNVYGHIEQMRGMYTISSDAVDCDSVTAKVLNTKSTWYVSWNFVFNC